ncbi:MAG: response regulator [Bacteroidales bacterium]|nr:response regulator [Bacteroidales bacterium]
MSEVNKSNLPCILLIDDKAYNRILFREVLSDINVCIDEAASGSEGLSLLERKSYALVCLDVQMPGMNGFEVLEKIKKDNPIAMTPVILVSGAYYDERNVLKGVEMGAIDFISKPFNIDIFRHKVNNIISLYGNLRDPEKETLDYPEQKESDRVVKQFMDKVNHELRTPIHAINGISSMLLKYHAVNLFPIQKEGLKIIRQSGERLLDLVNNVLDLSRIESRNEKVNEELVNLDTLLASLRSTALSLIHEKPVIFTLRKSDSVPEYILSDSRKIQQILINLISNSVKFTEEGKIQLNLHLIGDQLHFELSDTGIGIEKENLDRIFERFVQVEQPARGSRKGAGLGLNIVKELVQLMGGQISIESHHSKGTIMRFYLRMKLPDKEQLEMSSEGQDKREIWFEHYDSNKKLVLLIDYRVGQQFLIAGLLHETGYQVVSCYSASKALSVISLLRPDLIILNMEMPKFHGYTLLTKIKKDVRISSTPILAFTSIPEMMKTPGGMNIRLINETLREDSLSRVLGDMILVPVGLPDEEMVVLDERGSSNNPGKLSKLETCANESAEKSLIMLQRRKVNQLVLSGIDKEGENMKLCRLLGKQKNNLCRKLIILYERDCRIQMEEIEEKLAVDYQLSFEELEENNSFLNGLSLKEN